MSGFDPYEANRRLERQFLSEGQYQLPYHGFDTTNWELIATIVYHDDETEYIYPDSNDDSQGHSSSELESKVED